jgi:hypothetical protein
MFGKRKNTLILKVLVVFVSFAFATAGFAARIIPTGKVSIIKDGKVVGEFSQEAPLPEGSLLRCEDKCTIQLDDTYMVVDSGTVFSLEPTANSNELYVQEGTVYYSINESSRPMHINTPAGDVTTGDLTMTENELRGYVRVSGNETEIGVIGGGTMMVETTSGDMAVIPGRAITIAAIEEGSSSGASGGDTGGLTRNQQIGLGVAAAAVLTTGAILLASDSGGGGGGGDGGSPAAP